MEYLDPEHDDEEDSDEFNWLEDENKLDEKSNTYLSLINCMRRTIEKGEQSF